MKKLIVAILALSATAAQAQKISADKVPSIVSKAFTQKYPNAKDVKWELEQSNYEASFKEDGNKRSVLMEPSGKQIESETAIATEKLPQSVRNYVAQNYKGAKIKEAAEIVKASGERNYEAEVNGMDLLFNTNGEFIKAVKD